MTPHLRKCAPDSPPPPAERNGLVRSSPTKFRLLRISRDRFFSIQITSRAYYSGIHGSFCAALSKRHCDKRVVITCNTNR
jgi:hypothetical protein